MLDHIGANWQQLEASELFVNPYADPAAAASGSPEAMAAASGGVTYLQYTGNEALEYAIIMINTGTPIEGENVVQYNGAFSRTTFTEFIDGVAPWGQVSLQLTVGNNSSIIQVFDSGADSVSTDALAEILAAVESIIGAP